MMRPNGELSRAEDRRGVCAAAWRIDEDERRARSILTSHHSVLSGLGHIRFAPGDAIRLRLRKWEEASHRPGFERKRVSSSCRDATPDQQYASKGNSPQYR